MNEWLRLSKEDRIMKLFSGISDWQTPPEIKKWFIDRFVHDDNARQFAYRVQGLIDRNSLSPDQQKKINYELQRKYAWLDFIIERIDADRHMIYPQSLDANWARGEIKETANGLQFFTLLELNLFSKK